MTLRSILAPLDGSAFGEHALPYALSLARRSGARLELVNVVVPKSLFDLPDSHVPMPLDVDRRASEQAREYLDDVTRRIKSAARVEVTSTLLEGLVADTLCEFITRMKPNLVVLTTHGRGPLSRLWLGSVATELAQRAPAPLLLVRPKDTPVDLAADQAPRRILVPLDGSSFGEHIVPLAVALGKLTGAEYRLLRAVPPVLIGVWDGAGVVPDEGARTVSDQLASEAQTYLKALVGRSSGLATAKTHVVVDWPPAGAILADAEANGVDLIAMETRGRSGLVKLLLGSVADKVVRGATVPVLLQRPTDN